MHWWCWLLIVKLRICHFAFNVSCTGQNWEVWPSVNLRLRQWLTWALFLPKVFPHALHALVCKLQTRSNRSNDPSFHLSRDPSPAGSSRDNTDLQHTLPLLSSPEKLQHADHHLDAVAWQLGVKACQAMSSLSSKGPSPSNSQSHSSMPCHGVGHSNFNRKNLCSASQ